jgi:hypothetical protein
VAQIAGAPLTRVSALRFSASALLFTGDIMESVLAFVAALPVLFVLGLKAAVVVGLIGSLIEEIGKRFNLPKLAAFGDTLEAISVDAPKVIEKLKSIDWNKLVSILNRTKLPIVLLCIGISGSASACTNVKPALTSAQVSTAAFKAAGAALAIADATLAAYMDTFESPTQAEVEEAEAILDKLKAVKAKLDAAQDLRGIVEDLRAAGAALSKAGAKVPSSLARALDEASK